MPQGAKPHKGMTTPKGRGFLFQTKITTTQIYFLKCFTNKTLGV